MLIGAGLMIRSFAQLVNISPGFDPKNVLVGRISFLRRTRSQNSVTFMFSRRLTG